MRSLALEMEENGYTQVRGPQERCPGTVLTAEKYQREGIARVESGP